MDNAHFDQVIYYWDISNKTVLQDNKECDNSCSVFFHQINTPS